MAIKAKRGRKQAKKAAQQVRSMVANAETTELQFSVGSAPGRVMVTFNQPVAWFGLSVEDGQEFLEILQKHLERAASLQVAGDEALEPEEEGP